MPQSLARVIVRGKQGGLPMPEVFPSLTENKAIFRRSSLHLVAGVPGSMKSMFALTVADKMNIPTLYFSSDSDDFTMGTRLLAMKTGSTTEEAEKLVAEEPEFAAAALAEYNNIRWNFHPSPTLDDIWLEAEAHLEMFGYYPELTVIDIAMDVDHQDGDEFATLRSLMREMKRYARETESGVLVVHHTTEAVQGDPCQPRSAIMGKIAQLPVLIFTTGVRGNTFSLAVVKNRFGKGPADASLRLNFDVDGDRCSITEQKPKVYFQGREVVDHPVDDYQAFWQ
jgi:diadenosine tetraphosphatase ApaH/serine/threonine PP2A family protein phosphatase